MTRAYYPYRNISDILIMYPRWPLLLKLLIHYVVRYNTTSTYFV
jgi:hypothetical protein